MSRVNRGPWIQTHSGKQWHYNKPDIDSVDIEDIAHALSLLCRFGGHVSKFYSVAEHSVRASKIVPLDYQLWALMHDASEAYCVDVPSPLKHSPGLEGYAYFEAITMKAICESFELPWPEPPQVKQVDRTMLMTEQRDLMGVQAAPWSEVGTPLPGIIKPWSPKVAEKRFLKRFYELYKVN